MAEPMFMLQLEERLHADRNGELQRSLIGQLEALHASLVHRRRQLNEPETYRRFQAAVGAVEGALDALRTLRVRQE